MNHKASHLLHIPSNCDQVCSEDRSHYRHNSFSNNKKSHFTCVQCTKLDAFLPAAKLQLYCCFGLALCPALLCFAQSRLINCYCLTALAHQEVSVQLLFVQQAGLKVFIIYVRTTPSHCREGFTIYLADIFFSLTPSCSCQQSKQSMVRMLRRSQPVTALLLAPAAQLDNSRLSPHVKPHCMLQCFLRFLFVASTFLIPVLCRISCAFGV